MTDTRLYLATYYLKTPHTNNRKWGVYDYLLSFVTEAVEHPEVIRQGLILDDACERIPHLYQFLESVLNEHQTSQEPPASISLLDCDVIDYGELVTLPPAEYLFSHYCLSKVYGDETDILELKKEYYPDVKYSVTE
tara:strand:- start:663 stop:1070 length:408 start_codon:yes stop_codon:yes gene_type:complete